MRIDITRVFPLPAPAKIRIGPSVVSTASRCCGFNWSTNDKREWLRSSVKRILQEPATHCCGREYQRISSAIPIAETQPEPSSAFRREAHFFYVTFRARMLPQPTE